VATGTAMALSGTAAPLSRWQERKPQFVIVLMASIVCVYLVFGQHDTSDLQSQGNGVFSQLQGKESPELRALKKIEAKEALLRGMLQAQKTDANNALNTVLQDEHLAAATLKRAKRLKEEAEERTNESYSDLHEAASLNTTAAKDARKIKDLQEEVAHREAVAKASEKAFDAAEKPVEHEKDIISETKQKLHKNEMDLAKQEVALSHVTSERKIKAAEKKLAHLLNTVAREQNRTESAEKQARKYEAKVGKVPVIDKDYVESEKFMDQAEAQQLDGHVSKMKVKAAHALAKAKKLKKTASRLEKQSKIYAALAKNQRTQLANEIHKEQAVRKKSRLYKAALKALEHKAEMLQGAVASQETKFPELTPIPHKPHRDAVDYAAAHAHPENADRGGLQPKRRGGPGHKQMSRTEMDLMHGDARAMAGVPEKPPPGMP